MNLIKAEIELDGRTVTYEDNGSPILTIAVHDFADAQELLATLDRSAARKAAAKKDAAPSAKPEEEVPKHRDPPKCIRPGCIFDVDTGDTCREDAGATAEQLAEWRAAREVTPKTEGGKRARAIRSVIEDGGSPGPRAA